MGKFIVLCLCNSSGRSTLIEPQDWRELLAIAQKMGWTPRGTSQPPMVFDVDHPSGPSGCWNGSYNTAQGQMVTREDAEVFGFALANAIDRALPERLLLVAREIVSLANGGFLICAAAESSYPAPQQPVAAPKPGYSFPQDTFYKLSFTGTR